jgi:hypothetical protein
VKLDRIVNLANGVVGLQFSDGIYHSDKALHSVYLDDGKARDREHMRRQFESLARDAALEIAILRMADEGLLAKAATLRPDLFGETP